MTARHDFIIASSDDRHIHRLSLHTCQPLDERMSIFDRFLEITGTRPLSVTHQMHALAGPEHEHHEAALAAYGLVSLKPCDERIVQRALDLLVLAEFMESGQVDAIEGLRGIITSGYASEYDWDHTAQTAAMIVTAFFGGILEIERDAMDREDLLIAAGMNGALAVAMSAAISEHNFRATGGQHE